jgi:ribonuclease VapC
MFVDASALVALITAESDADALAARLNATSVRMTSAVAIYEATLAIARKHSWTTDEAKALALDFLVLTSIEIMPISGAEADAALEAHERFGKGRHPARLNIGDCFAYACAKTHGLPLLFKGDDFAKTDIVAA